MAMRLGTISPNAMEKKLMTMVMTTIEKERLSTPCGSGRFSETSASVR